jgi:hypothetical protein
LIGLLCGALALLPALEGRAYAQQAPAPAPAAAPAPPAGAPPAAAPAPAPKAGAPGGAYDPWSNPAGNPPSGYAPPAGYPPAGYAPPPGYPPPGYQAYPPIDTGRVVAQATADAKADTGVGWFFIGCLGLLGIIVAFVAEPSPPPERFVGKSPEYVNTYSTTYKSAGKNAQGTQALYGCLVGTGIFIGIYAILIASYASSAQSP